MAFVLILVIAAATSIPLAEKPAMGQKFNPVASSDSVVEVENARFTFLTPRLLRLEWAPDGSFEDRASFAFVNRDLPVPGPIQRRIQCADGVDCGGRRHTISTDKFEIDYSTSYSNGKTRERFDEPAVLSVKFKSGGKSFEWTPDSKPTANLKGTVRTLDGVSGSCELEPGLLSRDGWVLIDDSDNLLFEPNDTDWPWATPRRHIADPTKPKAIDWYLFCHGDDYKGALADFTKIAGKIPLPPRYALGSWWSRYWAYTDDELKGIVAQFNEHDVPLDVLVIDMDWHLDGWTGYTWNKDYFPDSAAFLKWCKDNHLFVTLNLHPADGVGKHESQFAAFKAAMGITEKTCYRVPFDCTDRKFIEHYFTLLHHPEEAKGVDFWWMDWQQGKNTKIPGLDPLYWLNYLHWTDFERRSEQGLSLGGTAPGGMAPGGTALRAVSSPTKDSQDTARRAVPPNTYGDKRPLIFSRWGGLGNHRYQIGFSGDTYNNWESLAFQPYFTATAANVGYGYWSHDIGGHQPGPVEPELYARWIQYGIFSPILRTHCGKRPDAERRIWAFPDEVFHACREAFHLRYAMIPYTYTACRKAYDTGISLCRPLYYAWPKLEDAYTNPDQYMFGDDLMLAPVVAPANPVSNVASADLWFPPIEGGWVEWGTGRVFDTSALRAESETTPSTSARGSESRATTGTTLRLSFALREIPVFARSGAIIPMQPKMSRTGEKPVDPLILQLFDAGPHGARSGKTEVYEDDGITSAYERGEHATTRITHALSGKARTIEIHPAEGTYKGMPEERAYEARLAFVLPPETVQIDGHPATKTSAEANTPGWWFNAETMTLHVRTARQSVRKPATIRVELSQVSDAPLRAGLMGQLVVLDDIISILGTSTPDSIRQSAAIRSTLATNPARAMESAAALQANWWPMLQAINTCPARESARQKAQARLLGLACDVTLKGESANTIAAEAHVAFAPRFERQADVGVHINFSCNNNSGWKLADCSTKSHRLTLGTGLTAAAKLSSSSAPNLGEVRTSVTIDADNTQINIALAERFCPSINAWHVLGPFDGPQEDQITKPHIPETKPVDLKQSHPGLGGLPVKWQKAHRALGPTDDPRKEFFVDFHKAFGKEHEDAVAYAVTWLESDTDRKVTLALGSDDGAVIWINAVEVFRKYTQRGYAPKDDRFEVPLRKGRNELLMKIGQAKGAWGFAVFIEDEKGNPIPSVRVID